ncbi:MAG TPA: hypothetical protein DC054_11960 [Blastocatellia bacterium]|nr:hypothetical protein [Blastocatellia bacterium]
MEDSVQDFYRRNVRPMTQDERKQLAALILNELSGKTTEKPRRKADITTFFGMYKGGDPNGSDNEKIDADLARAYADDHETET